MGCRYLLYIENDTTLFYDPTISSPHVIGGDHQDIDLDQAHGETFEPENAFTFIEKTDTNLSKHC